MCIDLDYYSSYSYALYYSWYRHGTVLLGHAVVDATEVWLDPTDNRAHNRVVSTAPTHSSVPKHSRACFLFLLILSSLSNTVFHLLYALA